MLPFLNTKAFFSVACVSLRGTVFSGSLLNAVFPCKSVLPHDPCTLWPKFGFVSGEVWDSALNLRSTTDTQENQLSSVCLIFCIGS